ncbi:hypothetical protein L1049_016470 [Liquidambar formosana]|uniref:F-box associated beta-propeller type 3 domain-containing protein n=1 Tax=Liquidambar formosana TaxID=63359 RepID=A0AAP0X7J5_LIQFO
MACFVRDIIFVGNPSTREFRRLPESGFATRYDRYFSRYLVYGFGYDESIDDYKVVAVLCKIGNGLSETEVKVYTLRTNSWRRIQEFLYGPPQEPCQFVSGALNWVSLRHHGGFLLSWALLLLIWKRRHTGRCHIL